MQIKLQVNKEEGKVYLDGHEVHINPQASKGPNNEVVDLAKEIDTNVYQRYISLSRLVDGENIIDLKPRKEVALSSKIVYTQEEQEELDRLQARIDEIKEIAKKRSPQSTKKDITKYSIEELESYLEMKRQEEEKAKLELLKMSK